MMKINSVTKSLYPYVLVDVLTIIQLCKHVFLSTSAPVCPQGTDLHVWHNKIKISCGLEEEKGMLSMLLSWKAAARPEHLDWRPNRGRWACMVPVEAVTAHVTAAAPAIAPGTPHMREKASSPPAFATSPHPPANTTAVSVRGKNRGLIWMSC